MYGAQALDGLRQRLKAFENDVEMYGAQARTTYILSGVRFENDVEMYGAQAFQRSDSTPQCLRMM